MLPLAFSSTSIDLTRFDCGTVNVTSVEPALCALFWINMTPLIFALASGEKIDATAPGRKGTSIGVVFDSSRLKRVEESLVGNARVRKGRYRRTESKSNNNKHNRERTAEII